MSGEMAGGRRHRARVRQAVRLTFFCFSFRAPAHFSDWARDQAELVCAATRFQHRHIPTFQGRGDPFGKKRCRPPYVMHPATGPVRFLPVRAESLTPRG
jgi:hypothetical protein